MERNKLRIREVTFIGPGRDAAGMAFTPGLNVVCGASDTGKSFLVEVIDFLLGGGTDLRDIPERIGYDQARIGVETSGGDAWTFERGVSGGNYNYYEGLIGAELLTSNSGTLKAKHAAGKDDNISGWLLKAVGLFDKLLRKNKAGGTRSLSFRDLARLIIVTEKEIIRQDTPFLSGQVVAKTAEYSALKLLLTGTDDSGVVPLEKNEVAETGVLAKLELLDQLIADVESEIAAYGDTKEDLLDQLERLDSSIASQRTLLEGFQSQLNDSISRRREVVRDREQINDRLDEISDLIERFSLLREHYSVDIDRLTAIEESGSLFVHHERVACPLCGSLPNELHVDDECDGNIESVVIAATAEIEKIKALSLDLDSTMQALYEESVRLREMLRGVDADYEIVDQRIREAISPELMSARESYTDFVDKKNDVSVSLKAYQRLEKLVLQKEGLLNDDEDSGGDEGEINSELSKYVLNEFSQAVQAILKAWDFPDAVIPPFITALFSRGLNCL